MRERGGTERIGSRAWGAALAEHDGVVARFRAVVDATDVARWHVVPAPGRWSPAEEALHVVRTYELGTRMGAAGARMVLRVPPLAAALSRTLLLPAMLRLGRFPRGAASPAEVYPDAAEAARLAPADVDVRLVRAAQAARDASLAAGQRGDRVGVVHAYFGTLDPLTTLRLLSAHTRHHATRLAAPIRP